MFALIKRVAVTLHKRRARRIAVGELSALSDRALMDIGINRGEIRSVVEKQLQGTESATIRPEPDAEAQATTANARTPFAYEREHKAAA